MQEILSRINDLSPEQLAMFEDKLRAKHVNLQEYRMKNLGIGKAEESDAYPVSSIQKRLFILHQIGDLGCSYNMPAMIKIKGNIEYQKIEDAINRIIEKHEILRTFFAIKDGEVVQKVCAFEKLRLEYDLIDEKHLSAGIEEFVKPFDLMTGPLFRCRLYKLHQGNQFLLLDIHHIISDGESMKIFIREFRKAYEEGILDEAIIQYKDFSAWENKFKLSSMMKDHENYWMNIFKEPVESLNLPLDYPRPLHLTFEGSTISFQINGILTDEIRNIAKENNATLFMTLLSFYYILLYKYTGQEDIVIGTPVTGRYHNDLKNLLGMFVNTIALRNYPKGSKSYLDFLSEIISNSIQSYKHEAYSFEDLIGKININNNKGHNILFDTMLVLQYGEDRAFPIGEAVAEIYDITPNISKFDLTFVFTEYERHIDFHIEYNTNLFCHESIERMGDHFLTLLNEITHNSKVIISNLSILSEMEKERILGFNKTDQLINDKLPLDELFEIQVRNSNNCVAVISGDHTITYLELNERANQLARTLRNKGIGRNDIVSLFIDRSIELIISMFAVLKAGATYLPIDKAYPIERIKFMLFDSNSILLLVDEDIDINHPYINIKESANYNENNNNLAKIHSEKDLAYIIYTSGTTGKPKGVMVEHRNISNTIQWRVKEYHSDSSHIALQLFSHAFDGFITSFFTTIVSGGTIILPSENEAKNPEYVKQLICQHRVTHFIVVPSFYEILLECFSKEDLDSVKVITLAGEKVTKKLIEQSKALKNTMEIVNEYGPTENSVATTICRNLNLDDEKVTIGKPIANSRVYILNKDNNLCPIGIEGELCISGKGVARGYVNNLELTEQKFVKNPYENEERMYRTGDVCRWLDNGTIEFLHRKDKQLKIRGYRVEVNEIIECLESIPYIKHAIVSVKGDSNNLLLCAYLVSESVVEVKEIYKFISTYLPEYMIPNHIFFIDHIPTTPTGKLDEKALPEPKIITTDRICDLPTNMMEEKLLIIFQEILQVEQMGIHHDFFEMGGQSLKAGQLISRIYKVFDVLIPLKSIFEQPTVSKLAKYLRTLKDKTDFNMKKIEGNHYYCTSFAQKNLFFLSQAEGIDTTYNMPCVLDIKGDIDVKRMDAAFKKIIQRHEILRTAFRLEDGEVVQIISEKVDFKLQTIKCSYINIEKHRVDFIQAFRLEEAPLVRACLLSYGHHLYKLLIDIHHIAGDAKSINILISELIDLYKGEDLPDLYLQYKDFAAWQNRFLDSDYIKQQENYWINIYKKEIPLLSMPLDYLRPVIQSFKGKKVSLKLNKELCTAIRELCKETKLTTYMFFLSCYYLLLHKYSSQKDIIVGTPVEGRTNPNVNTMIGMFVNTLALRAEINEKLSFFQFINYVKSLVIDGLNNQDYPFMKLVQSINLNREQSRNPLFDTMFSMNDMNQSKFEIGSTEFKVDDLPGSTAKFDITLDVNELGEDFECELEYCTDLFTGEKMQQLLINYAALIQEVTANPNLRIENIPFISRSEIQRLQGFNKKRVTQRQEITITELFEKQVVSSPNAIAVKSGDNTITYQELNKQSNRVAHKLQSFGVLADTIVGLFMTPSIEMIVSMLGVMKAGGCYLPIDTDLPVHRVTDILKDADVSILLTNHIIQLKTLNVKHIYEIGSLIDDKNLVDHNLVHNISRNDLMYIIYTSGSSGKPKGVMVEHGNVMAYVEAFKNEFMIRSTDVMLQQASYSFDTFVEEVYPTLITGGKIVIAQKECIMDVNALLSLIYNEKITMISCSPLLISILNQKEDLGKVHTIISGGDILRYNYISNLLNKVKVYNTYGPTEATVCAAYYQCKSNDASANISIGKPILNYEIIILNEYHQMVPVGVAGELCIGGLGVARGYLNRPELTEEKFITHPFRPGEKIYRTGDLARWNANGDIDFLGRIDNQVKIRGYRIELEEIEKCLTNHKAIDKAIVLAKGDGSDKRLVAYIESNGKIGIENLKASLKDILPHYMIPDHIVQLDQLPLNTNGKIDIIELQKIEVMVENQVALILPTTNIEKLLLNIWKELFHNNNLGIRHNFFDIGGHSLKAMLMIVQAQKNGIDIRLNQIMKYQTVEELSAQLVLNEDTDHLITDIEEINTQLKERFSGNNRIVIYDFKGETYVVLYISFFSGNEKEEITSYIKKYCVNDLFPHYIRVVDQHDINSPTIKALSSDEFSKYLGLLKLDINEGYDNILQQVLQQQVKLNQFLLQNEIDEEMPVSASQKMYLKFHNGYSGTVINLNKPIYLEHLKSAIKKLIINQPFMHSTFEKSNRGDVWKRRRINNIDIDLPLIDLSVFNIDDRNLLRKKLIQNFYFYPYQLYGSILFRVLIIRESEKNYSVIFPFHHVIFDDISENIVRDKILNYYYSFEKGEGIKEEDQNEYHNYTKHQTAITEVIQEKRIIELFDLNAYVNAHSLIKNQIINEKNYIRNVFRDRISINESINVEIPMPYEFASLDENYPLTLALNYLVDVLGNYFSIANLPIVVLSYGRRYKDYECSNIIGAFIDFIPVLLNPNELSMAEKLIDNIQLAAKENINFINLQEATGLCNLKSIFEKIMDFMITVNFLGRQEIDNDTTISYLEEYIKENSNLKKMNFDGLSIEICYTINKLKLFIQSQNYEIDQKLKKMILRKAEEYSERLTRKN